MTSTDRQRYVVTYDVRDPKRLRRIFKVLKGFGRHVQLSVFICDLSPMKTALLRAALHGEVDHEEDQVLFVDVGPTYGRGTEVVTSVGRPYEERVREAKVF